MKRRRILWLLGMAALCIVLYTIVVSRTQSTTEIIFGGADGAYIQSDSTSYANINLIKEPEPEPEPDIWPQIDITLPQYRMVRDQKNFLLLSSFTPELEKASVGYDVYFDAAEIQHLEDLIAAIKEEGYSFSISTAYMSYSYLYHRFNGTASGIAERMGVTDYNDPDYQLAVAEAKKKLMFPGSSEHQLGLAIDIFDSGSVQYNLQYQNKEFYDWLNEHCAEYGFIQRYPTRKYLLTGWDEPWHYRYVGVEAAKFIMEQGICYEEFYAHYNPEFKY